MASMKRHRVELRPAARDDLTEIALFIARQASPTVALAYTRRIREACARLEHFPECGTLRDDIRPGLRTLGFEGRVSIVFEVLPGTVTILRILYGGRDLAASLRGSPDAG